MVTALDSIFELFYSWFLWKIDDIDLWKQFLIGIFSFFLSFFKFSELGRGSKYTMTIKSTDFWIRLLENAWHFLGL